MALPCNAVLVVLLLRAATIESCSSEGDPAGTRRPNDNPATPAPPTDRGPGWKGIAKGTADSGPYTGGARRDVVDSASQLSCNSFDQSCRWRNADDDQLDWQRGTGRPDPAQMQRYTGTSQVPSDPYLVVAPDRAQNPNALAKYESDPIPCLQGDGEVTFKYWTTPNVRLRVCTRPIGISDYDYCSQPDINAGDPGPARAVIPGPIQDPFQIVIEAQGFITADDFAAIDDITYTGNFCSRGPTTPPRPGVTTRPTTQRPGATTRPPPPLPGGDGAACQTLKCDFNPGQSCAKSLPPPGPGSKNNWQIGKGQVGNRNTGIPKSPTQPDGSYGFVDGPTNGNKVLAMPAVTLSQARDLAFQYYKASYGAAFEVQVNGQPAYTDDETTSTSRQWRQKTVTLPQGQNQVSFVSRSLKENQFIGLDDVNLRNEGSSQNLC